MDVVPPAVMVAGMVQLALAAPTVGLVFAGSRWGYLRRHGGGVRQRSGVHRRSSAAELGLLQRQLHQRINASTHQRINASPAARVTWFSWVTAILEIFADVLFGAVGVMVLRARRQSSLPGSAQQR
jgi:hypothetical protein